MSILRPREYMVLVEREHRLIERREQRDNIRDMLRSMTERERSVIEDLDIDPNYRPNGTNVRINCLVRGGN